MNVFASPAVHNCVAVKSDITEVKSNEPFNCVQLICFNKAGEKDEVRLYFHGRHKIIGELLHAAIQDADLMEISRQCTENAALEAAQ